jgi:hypothetical protein
VRAAAEAREERRGCSLLFSDELSSAPRTWAGEAGAEQVGGPSSVVVAEGEAGVEDIAQVASGYREMTDEDIEVFAAAIAAPAAERGAVVELELDQLSLVASRIFEAFEERVKVTRALATTQHLLEVVEKAWLDQGVSSIEAFCEILITAIAVVGGPDGCRL